MTLQLLPCPACERVTALTVEVQPSVRLRCPHCGEEFLYSTLARETRLHWEVVESKPVFDAAFDAVAEPSAGSKTIDEAIEMAGSQTLDMGDVSAQTLVDALGVYEGLELEATHSRHGLDVSEDSQAGVSMSEIEVSPAAPVGSDESSASETDATRKKNDWSGFQPLAPELHKRRKRKQSSSLWSVVQVALGGVAAIPIALLLVWHVIGTDVGDAGRWVGSYVPWIVPEKFRPYQSLPIGKSDREVNRRENQVEGQLGSGLPKVTQKADADLTRENNDLLHPPSLDLPPSIEPQQPAVPERVPSAVELSGPLLKNAFATIRQTTALVDNWTSASAQKKGGELQALALETYGGLANLALMIDQLALDNLVLKSIHRELGTLGLRVAEDSKVRELINKGAPFWVAQRAKRPTDVDTAPTDSAASADVGKRRYGLAMIVAIEEVELVEAAEAKWWRVVATPASRLGEPQLEIRIPTDVASSLATEALASGNSLFLLGVVRVPDETQVFDDDSAPPTPSFVASYAVGL